jgi:hypothetical protein
VLLDLPTPIDLLTVYLATPAVLHSSLGPSPVSKKKNKGRIRCAPVKKLINDLIASAITTALAVESQMEVATALVIEVGTAPIMEVAKEPVVEVITEPDFVEVVIETEAIVAKAIEVQPIKSDTILEDVPDQPMA